MPAGLLLQPTLNQYSPFAFDLDAAMAGAGIAADGDVYIRFTHSGSSTTQEMTLDDLRVSNADVFGPRVATHSTTTPAGAAPVTITLNFNEPIDPATFTAADVLVMSPLSTATPLDSGPVPNADNKTYTITFTPPYAGSYTLRLGPDIRDFAGNLLNQDADVSAGETDGQDQYSGTIAVGTAVAQTIPYTQAFDSSSPAALAGWTFTSSGTGAISLSGTNTPYTGAGHLRLAQGTTGSSEEARLLLDLSAHVGATNLVLDFWYQVVTPNMSLGVAVSGDGVTWITPFAAGSPSVVAYSHFALDLDSYLASVGIVLDSDVYVRFLSNPATGPSETTLDQVRVYRGVTNVAPTLSAVSTLFGTEDTNLSISYAQLQAGANEADSNGNTLQFRIEGVTFGTLTKNGVPVEPGITLLTTGESLTWTPPANFNGTVNPFTIRAYDGDLVSGYPVNVPAASSGNSR